MTITAKFPGKCATCGGVIQAGEQIEWSKGQPARHTTCEAKTVASAKQTAAAQGHPARQIRVERVGRRSYLRGDTINVRGLLKDGGCKWDADERAWWVGDHAKAETLAAQARTAPAEAAPQKRITHCIECGSRLDDYQQRRGFRFCSQDCANDRRLGGQSGYVNGHWHQGSDD